MVSKLIQAKWNPPFDEQTSFAGKTVLITGATSGLGLEAAQKLAALKPDKLIITARSLKKGQSAKKQIELNNQTAGYSTGAEGIAIEIYELDMDDSSSIKAFCRRVNSDVARLDAVILNAGAVERAYNKGPEGWERTIQVNTISTTLLALLLLPKLLATARPEDPAHLSFISSGLALVAKPESVRKYYDSPNALENMSTEKSWPGGQRQYALSKLLLEYSMRHIAKLSSVNPPTGKVQVIVNSTCPGMCKTDLGRQYTDKSMMFRVMMWLVSLLVMRTAEAGSRSYVSALTRGEESQGKIWKNDSCDHEADFLDSPEGKAFGDKVWLEMVAVMEKLEPSVKEVLT